MAPMKGPFFRLHLAVVMHVMVHVMMRMMMHHRFAFRACD
jgi:hypothetical protein